ncbi:DJ-1/PfpI family protein [Catenulispora sp. NF23]|uniref:DJ-1/PfpI family protein n=1 Tax=Catenulispora pinistramenti TaxID=2705254 RepID=A0ABS5KHP5_9ACTN|nr:DJ-1/PfpI family protein [Catenulispora pinistramenti]MBS2536204.1 DJ-1/PfpI family protein [Catenulispora pinistramenti]MBS2545608.1 DJ-1/PfpI family protein [Catenulispora pinistramenti]
MTRRIAIPLFPGFMPLDLVGPYDVLRFLPDTETVFVAAEPGVIPGADGGFGLQAQAAPADIESCDILLVPGGGGTRDYEARKPLIDWIGRMHETTTWTTSVCTGSLLLGAAGILKDLDATTHWNAVKDLESHGAHYTADRVVRRGKVITAAGVSSGIDMALTLAGLIEGDEFAKAVQLWIEYDPQPPHDTGSVAKAGPELVRRTPELIREGGARRG